MAEKKQSNVGKELTTVVAYIAICIGVIAAVLLLDRLHAFDNPRNAMRDLRFRIRGPEAHAEDVVIVGIDPQSLDMLGLINMPPRDYHAQLIINLFDAGAKAVLFDFLFLTYTGQAGSDGFTQPSWEDSVLAGAIAYFPTTVIGRKEKVLTGKATQQTVGENPIPPALFQNRDQMAFVDMYDDNDSFIRRAKLITNDMDPELGWNYSYALRAAMYVLGADSAWVDTERHTAHVGDTVIPLNEENFMIINYPMDEKTYQEAGGYYSYEQVYDDSEWGIGILKEKGAFKDKVVLVGAAWPESGDVKLTPFYLGTSIFSENEYPMYGVHVHKSITSTILNKRFIVPYKRWHLFAMIVVMSVLATLINFKFRGFTGLLLCLLLIGVNFGASIMLFNAKRWMVPVVAPGFAVVILNYISAVTYNFLTERRQKAMIRGAFAQYVPPAVVGELLKNPDMLTLGGEERVMSVIFSDVAGFTTISESLTPTELVGLLNEYLTAMTDIVLSYDGIIDKYEGDAIMAEFGAPLPDEEHALKACHTALDMQKKLTELREKFKAEGKPELKARVGINSGTMVIGNMGSSRIFDYTVMGDNVNLSSRLEGANKVYGTYIMCSEATRKMVEHAIETRELDLLQVKGKTAGVLVHEVICRTGEELPENRKKALELYARGLEAYKGRRWDEGISLFTDALAADPDDSPSRVYLERCNEFKINPPPEDWDGIFIMRTK